MPTDLPPQYNPQSVEAAIYQKWLDAKAFHAVPDTRPPEKRFSMVIPPPNVTGALHLGHAINGTIQDILARYHRMKGDNTLWLPGIDHAGIATQAVVEKTIFEKEKKNRHDLGREELVRRIWEWKEQFGARILKQLEAIGVSCDWDRTRFTLDEPCAKAVREAFFKMFKDGLVFRGKRLVNWDTHLQTAVADDEIYHEPVKGQLTSIKYPVAPSEPRQSEPRPSGSDRVAPNPDGSLPDGRGSDAQYLIVATTRPETMLGDSALAVHPDDPRYQHLIGKFVTLPLIGRKIPIIADGLLVDPKFGTGVVKVTPAHDPNDYATGQRHNLEQINLLTPDGRVNENGQGEFLGQKYSYTGLKFATAARKKVLEDLAALNLIADQKPHDHEIGHSDRSKTPIEPYLSDQWFVRMGDITQSDPQSSEPRPLGSDRLAPEPETPHSNALAYFLSFHTYATWLHGSETGSIDPEHNQYGTPFLPPDPKLFELKRGNSKDEPLELSIDQRQSILSTIKEVAQHRGWTLHAVNVRPNHVHAVVSGNAAPERMMNDFKSWATRRMREANLVTDDARIWSRHGSTPYLWKPENVSEAVQYTLYKQGPNTEGTFYSNDAQSAQQQPEPRPSGSDPSMIHPTRSLPDGRGSDKSDADGITLANGTRAPGLAQAAIDAVKNGNVKIIPDRYAKGYIDWLSQKRDWCISRQLWWGHRIPVWGHTSLPGAVDPQDIYDFVAKLDNWEQHGRISHKTREDAEMARLPNVSFEDWKRRFICVRSPDDIEVIDSLESHGFTQDPDVLDTWFSSALWPLSTMGWPNTGTSEKPTDQLLPYFYPTSVLSTARDILTLWVARMVIFGLYLHGEVPFKNVFIHPVIQDGDGKIMSKSKGNGVDPLDIIHSHGADALRFTLASLATETQDIRMPVTKDTNGHNTSPKFDLGRNFANKIWNASRFILSNITAGVVPLTEQEALDIVKGQTALLEDRWILGQLAYAVQSVDHAINRYEFSRVAQNLYEFFWTDLCDWYLEFSKARIKAGDTHVQSILLHCLETVLKLLHPVMPFITEEIWSKLPNHQTMLIHASWPSMENMLSKWLFAGLSHHHLKAIMGLIQSVTGAIREIQNRYPAAKGKAVILRPNKASVQSELQQSRGIIESLASVTISENSTTAIKPRDAATAVLPDVEVYIPGVIDKSAESAKLTKRKLELEKFILANTNKLGNEAFVAKAPAKIIQGLRDQLAQQKEELAALEKNLAEL